MKRIVVECLKCGLPRTVRGDVMHAMGAGHCPRCSYVGWAYSDELDEDERRALRDVPVEFRRRAPAALSLR
jgi:hypothetical protein